MNPLWLLLIVPVAFSAGMVFCCGLAARRADDASEAAALAGARVEAWPILAPPERPAWASEAMYRAGAVGTVAREADDPAAMLTAMERDKALAALFAGEWYDGPPRWVVVDA